MGRIFQQSPCIMRCKPTQHDRWERRTIELAAFLHQYGHVNVPEVSQHLIKPTTMLVLPPELVWHGCIARDPARPNHCALSKAMPRYSVDGVVARPARPLLRACSMLAASAGPGHPPSCTDANLKHCWLGLHGIA